MNPMSGPSSNDELVTQLNRAIFLRESQLAASTLHQLLQVKPEFALEGKLQYDLARLLELGNEPNLALSAYEAIIEKSNEADEYFCPSLRAAGHLSYRVKNFPKCREFLERFLSTGVVAPNERTDAETILNKLPDGKGVRDLNAINAANVQAENNQQAFGMGGADESSALVMDSGFEEDSSSAIRMGSDDISNMPTSRDLSKLPSSQDLTKMPTSEDMNYMAEDRPGAPRLQPHRSPEGNLQPPQPTKAPGQGFGNLPPGYEAPPPPNEPVQGRGMSDDMMFGGPDPIDQADDNSYEEYGDTPPLKLDSRDLRNPRQSSTTVNQKDRDRKEREMMNRDLRVNQEAPESLDEIQGFAGGLFDVEDNKNDDPPMGGIDPIFNSSSEEEVDSKKVSAKKPVRSNLSPSELMNEYEDKTFSVLLPVDQKINVDEVVKFIIASEELSDNDAQRAVVERKGCLRSKLVLEDVVDIYNHSVRFKQRLIFVVDGFSGEDDQRLDATRVDILAPGLRLHTAAGSKKVRWEKIRFVTSGRLNRQPVIDLFVEEDFIHYRLLHGTMDFLVCCPRQDKNFNEACRDFLKELKRFAPDVYVSHTVRNLLNGRAYRPQKFTSEAEYDNYNRSVMLSHFGEEIPIKQLAEAYESVNSSW